MSTAIDIKHIASLSEKKNGAKKIIFMLSLVLKMILRKKKKREREREKKQYLVIKCFEKAQLIRKNYQGN